MSAKTKKATFNLHPDVIAVLNEAMAKGVAPSKNVLVERALVKKLKELQKHERRARWKEGAKDALLLNDIKSVEADFQLADAETSRGTR